MHLSGHVLNAYRNKTCWNQYWHSQALGILDNLIPVIILFWQQVIQLHTATYPIYWEVHAIGDKYYYWWQTFSCCSGLNDVTHISLCFDDSIVCKPSLKLWYLFLLLFFSFDTYITTVLCWKLLWMIHDIPVSSWKHPFLYDVIVCLKIWGGEEVWKLCQCQSGSLEANDVRSVDLLNGQCLVSD